jgi:hypothetical protein
MIVMSRWNAFQHMAADVLGFKLKDCVTVKRGGGYRTV